MNVDIQSLGFPITGALSDHVRRRLRFVLTRQSDRIERVVVKHLDRLRSGRRDPTPHEGETA